MGTGTFLLIVLLAVVVAGGFLLFMMMGGLEAREGRRRRGRARPQHMRVDNEAQARSSPARSTRREPAAADEPE